MLISKQAKVRSALLNMTGDRPKTSRATKLHLREVNHHQAIRKSLLAAGHLHLVAGVLYATLIDHLDLLYL